MVSHNPFEFKATLSVLVLSIIYMITWIEIIILVKYNKIVGWLPHYIGLAAAVHTDHHHKWAASQFLKRYVDFYTSAFIDRNFVNAADEPVFQTHCPKNRHWSIGLSVNRKIFECIYDILLSMGRKMPFIITSYQPIFQLL